MERYISKESGKEPGWNIMQTRGKWQREGRMTANGTCAYKPWKNSAS